MGDGRSFVAGTGEVLGADDVQYSQPVGAGSPGCGGEHHDAKVIAVHADQAAPPETGRRRNWRRLMSMAVPRIDSPCSGDKRRTHRCTWLRTFTAGGGGPSETGRF